MRISDWSSDVCSSDLQVRGFLGAEVRGEVGFDAVFLATAEWRVGEDDVDPLLLLPADVGPGQGVVVADEAGVLAVRSEERRVGKEWVRPFISRWSPSL